MLTETFDNVCVFETIPFSSSWAQTDHVGYGVIWMYLVAEIFTVCVKWYVSRQEKYGFSQVSTSFVDTNQTFAKKTNNTQITKPIPIEKANNSIENEGQKREIINTYILYSGQVPFMVCPVYSKGKCFCKLGWGLHPLFPCIPSLVYGKLNVMWQWWLQSPEVCHHGHLYGASA